MRARACFIAIQDEIDRLHDAGLMAFREGGLEELARCAEEAKRLEGEMCFWGMEALREAQRGERPQSVPRARV